MDRSTRAMPRAEFSEPDPFITADEFEARLKLARQVESFIQALFFDDFDLYTELIAVIELALPESLEPGGELSAEAGPPFGVPDRVDLMIMMNQLRMFCKHYMLHLDPNNITNPAWAYALRTTPDFDEDDFHSEDAMDARIESRMFDDDSFNTDPNLPDYPRDIEEEIKCIKRDNNTCVVTGKANPSLFWFIPSTWNDTAEHNNVTGRTVQCGYCMTGVIFDPRHNILIGYDKLGITHKQWNMLCADPVLHELLKSGLSAFKLFGEAKLEDGNYEATLQFYWMPQLQGCFGLIMDRASDWFDELEEFQLEGYPPPSSYKHNLTTKSGEPLRSGHLIHVKIPEQDIENFKSVVKVHWTCVVFAALCGAAGRGHLLSGRDFDNEVMVYEQDKVRREDLAVYR
ncbi:hypothetical protein FLONG3_10716 [Fusarium longipes]|uniref:HNH nuclease domain-containing protein n=1 Tax=Fusarium longipes TaxID=694270 RepID=A0A395RL12_9HYPO|nr:hypothetical protein FLONG3_10716 [Fusarium longipes]